MHIKVSQQPKITCETPTQIARGVFLSVEDVKRAVRRMLKKAGVKKAELSIVFLDGASMRRLNRASLGHDYVTDVVTFDLSGKREKGKGKREKEKDEGALQKDSLISHLSSLTSHLFIDGEIYVCPAEAKRNARLYGEPVEREVLRYVAHGILHLMGYDDATTAEREQMRMMEDEFLKKLDKGRGKREEGRGERQGARGKK